MAKPHPDQARLLAWEIFRSVQRGETYSHIHLPQALTESSLEGRDKAFVTELVYGALRMQGHSDYVVSQISDRSISDIDGDLLSLLRLAFYQVLHMRVPAHAAVSANVELARKVIGESKGSYVNALLRKATQKDLDTWLSPAAHLEFIPRTALLTSHPEWIVSAYLDCLKDEEEVMHALLSNNVPPIPTLVTWPGKSTQDELIQEGGAVTKYSPFGVHAAHAPFEYRAIRERRAGVQDEGSQIVVQSFFTAASGAHSILDVCAGPGGKAALLSHLSRREGKSFIANEPSHHRAELVRKVVGDVEVREEDGRDINVKVDAILADVPCTGIGALRRRAEVRWRRTPADLKSVLHLQEEIAQRALNNLNPGGILGYSTCSPHLSETRGIVESLLRKNPDVEEIVVPVDVEGSHNGKSMQLWGHRHNTDAMFLALLKRKTTV